MDSFRFLIQWKNCCRKWSGFTRTPACLASPQPTIPTDSALRGNSAVGSAQPTMLAHQARMGSGYRRNMKVVRERLAIVTGEIVIKSNWTCERGGLGAAGSNGMGMG